MNVELFVGLGFSGATYWMVVDDTRLSISAIPGELTDEQAKTRSLKIIKDKVGLDVDLLNNTFIVAHL